MMRILVRTLVGTGLAIAAAQAMSFQPLGYQAMGMGGAGVASSTGSMAPYYNPALLAAHDYTAEIVLSGQLGLVNYRLAEYVDRLADDDLTGTIERIADNAPVSGSNSDEDRANIKDAVSVLDEMSRKDSGLVITPGAALGIQWKNFAIGVYGTSEGTASPVIDSDHLGIIVKDPDRDAYYTYDPDTDIYATTDKTSYEASSLQYALDNELTYLKLQGISIAEVPFSYGHAFDTKIGTIGVGGSLKYMYGYTYNTHISIDTQSGDINDAFKDRDKKSSTFGVDLGLFYEPAGVKHLRFGLVGKDLNTPEFDVVPDPVTGETDKVKVKPRVRAGMYYSALNKWLDVAIDVDLTSNETYLEDYDAQYVGGGINVHPVSWFSFRLGAMQNIADSTIGPVLTAGLGFGTKWFQIDLSAMASTSSGEFDGNSIPEYTRVNLALLSRW